MVSGLFIFWSHYLNVSLNVYFLIYVWFVTSERPKPKLRSFSPETVRPNLRSTWPNRRITKTRDFFGHFLPIFRFYLTNFLSKNLIQLFHQLFISLIPKLDRILITKCAVTYRKINHSVTFYNFT